MLYDVCVSLKLKKTGARSGNFWKVPTLRGGFCWLSKKLWVQSKIVFSDFCRTKRLHHCFIYKLLLYDVCVGYKCWKTIEIWREVGTFEKFPLCAEVFVDYQKNYEFNQKSCFLTFVELNGCIIALFINYCSTMCVSATNVEKPSKFGAKWELLKSSHFARRFLAYISW